MILGSIYLSTTVCDIASPDIADAPMLNKEISTYVTQRALEFDKIPAERADQLRPLAEYLKKCLASGTPIRLNFICTHNSRRSHISQLWAAVAAAHYGISEVESYSGGTERTAFNPRAVDAMRRAGFVIEEMEAAGTKEPNNPKYQVEFAEAIPPQICFSKVYSDPPNPTADFCAVLTCSSADKDCPIVSGAVARVAIPYDDPKIADDTPGEAAKYDERVAQIAREMLYVFSLAK